MEADARVLGWVLTRVSVWVLEALRDRFSEGDRWALAEAIEVCAAAMLPMPPWVTDAYAEGFKLLDDGDATSWDEVLGRPPAERKQRRGRRAAQARESARRRIEIWKRVKQVALDGQPIGDLLFEDVGKEFGISKTTANRLYYAEERDQEEMLSWMESPAARELGRLLSEAARDLYRLRRQAQRAEDVDSSDRINRRHDTVGSQSRPAAVVKAT
jgi:hypothetical protein